ncbi:hypothetical protein [Leucobacter sp. cx-169]|uniref:hypothetical protein n=1 Tax=Leucobacter sp. cx-169 TaxID=2770549 RepID=UPI00165E2AC9|nr:hypothetical protein [Leucobacter sp. cx-169]MBC9927211.1 hypothetical protein [Leucobacter sp. cx-169]
MCTVNAVPCESSTTVTLNFEQDELLASIRPGFAPVEVQRIDFIYKTDGSGKSHWMKSRISYRDPNDGSERINSRCYRITGSRISTSHRRDLDPSILRLQHEHMPGKFRQAAVLSVAGISEAMVHEGAYALAGSQELFSSETSAQQRTLLDGVRAVLVAVHGATI